MLLLKEAKCPHAHSSHGSRRAPSSQGDTACQGHEETNRPDMGHVWVSQQSPLATPGSARGGQTPWACPPSARSCQRWGRLNSNWPAPAAPPVCPAARQGLCHAACAGSGNQAFFPPSLPPVAPHSERCLPTHHLVCLCLCLLQP